jgi:hypothetical protein
MLRLLSCLAICGFFLVPAQAEDQKLEMQLGQNKELSITAPKTWVRKEPKSRIVEHEFAAPVADGDMVEGRITVMGAGGDIQANIDRWSGQFQQPDGSDSKDKTKVEKKKISGLEVHVVQLTGTYLDMPGGPFAGGRAVPREDYKMLGAIVVAPKIGNYFIKFYGPKKTVSQHEADFHKMLESLKVNAQ